MSKKNNKKNSTRKNYKIEALEPRLMMSADPVIDFSDLDVVDSQLADLRDAAKNETASTISAQTQSVVFQLTDSADQSLTKISDFLNNVDSSIETFVENAFDYAKNNAKAYIDSYNKANPDLDPKDYIHSIGISDFLTYVKDYIDSTAASYSFKKIDGSTIDIGYKYNGTFDLNELGFGSAVDYLDEFKSVKNFIVDADISFSLNLNSDNDTIALEDTNDIAVSVSIDKVSAKIDNLGASTKFMNIEVNEVLDKAEKTPDLVIDLSSGKLNTNFDFEFDIDSKSLPFDFESGKYLEVSGTDSLNVNVSFPDVKMKNDPTKVDFSLDSLLSAIDVKQLPFLKDFQFTFNKTQYSLGDVENLVGQLNEYWARASVALNGVVDADNKEMDFSNLEKFFDILCQNKATEIDDIFNTIKLYKENSESDFVNIFVNSGLTGIPASTLKKLALGDANNPTTFTLEFKPNLKNLAKEIDLNLFKLDKLNDFVVDATLKVDVKVCLDNETLKFKEISLNDFVIKLTKPFTNENVHIGLFDTKLSGTFDYTINVDANGLKDFSIELKCDDIEIKSQNASIYKKPAGTPSFDFKFNKVESVWEFPDKLKKYFSLTGESLANNVSVYLNSLRTSLRALVEDKVKLDFLNGSAGSIVADAIAKIDYVINGGTLDGSDVTGIFINQSGSVKANFTSVEALATAFNTVWNKVFKLSSVPCVVCYANDKNELKTVAEFDALSQKQRDAFVFDHFVLKFNLSFGFEKSLDLNLVDCLGNSFTNVSTYGSINAKGNAGIVFSLDVNFDDEGLLNDTMLLGALWGMDPTDPMPQNEDYYETNKIVKVISGDEVSFDVFDKTQKKVVETVTVKNDPKKGGVSFSYKNGSSVQCLYENDQIIVKYSGEFEVRSSDEPHAYAELRLGSGVLQSTLICTVDDVTNWSKDLSLEIESKDSSSKGTLKIEKDILSKLSDVISSTETKNDLILKDLLNQYLNLHYQPNSDISLGKINVLLNEGCSIMNTYGLYVVNVQWNASTNTYTIRFGCDPSRIQNYDKEDYSHQYNLLNSSGTVDYMRTSEALISTGKIGDTFGVVLEKYVLSGDKLELDEREYLDFGSLASKTEAEVLKALPKLGSNYTFSINSEVDAGGKTVYTLVATPNNVVTGYYAIGSGSTSDTKILERYAFVNNEAKLVESKKITLGSTYAGPFDSQPLATSRKNALEAELNALFYDAYEVDVDKNSEGKFTLSIKVKTTVNEVYRALISDKFMTMTVTGSGSTTPQYLYVDTKSCSNVSSLAQVILNSAESQKITELKSVSVKDGKLLFTFDNGTAVNCACLVLDSTSTPANTNDFTLEYDSALSLSPKSVDFETLMIKGSSVALDSELGAIVEAINDEINPSRDDNKPTLYFTDVDGNALGHLEFRSKTAFELKNVGASKILEKLGFVAAKSIEYGKNDFRIIGKALLGIDWSKLIDFTAGAELNVSANAELTLSDTIIVAPSTNANTNKDNIEFVVQHADSDLVVNAIVQSNGLFYRIVDVGYDELAKAPTLIVRKYAEGYAGDTSKMLDSTVTTLSYLGGAVATVGFVDVNLVANGHVGFEADFTLKKTDKKDDGNFLGYEIVPKYNGTELVSNVKSKNESGLLKNMMFSIDAFVDIGNTISENIGHADIAINNEGKLDASSNLTSIANNAVKLFGEFNSEKLFAILESLVDRLLDVTKKTNIKIPVINKSVSDLVNVANDIRDIVNKLRADKIYTLQGLNDQFNKYLTDFGLLAKSAVSPFLMKLESNELVFNVDIDKFFSTVQQFSFGSSSAGISGNADLKVTGDFWLKLSARASLKDSSFDLLLDDAILFGAEVNILGQKLSFNLGLDGISDDNLLANLITVGSNDNSSCIKASASLSGSFGFDKSKYTNGLSVSELGKSGTVTCDLDVKSYGELPISVANYSLGKIIIGKSNGTDGVYAFTSNDANYSVKDAASGTSPFKFDVIKEKTVNEKNAYDLAKNSFIIDFSDVYKKISDLVDGNVGWFDKIKLAITGFNKLFDTLESQLNSGMMSSVKSVPVVGSALSGGVDFLGDLKRKVLEPFSDFVYETSGMTAEMVAQKLNELFFTYLKKVPAGQTAPSISVGAGLDAWKNDVGDGIYYRSGNDYAEWFLRLGGDYNFGTDIGLDLGFPGLGLETEGGVSLNLGWTLEFGFGVSKEGGLYFIFEDGNELDVTASTKFDENTKILGKLAGLGVSLKFDSDDTVSLGFGINLDGSNKDYALNQNLVGTISGKTGKSGKLAKVSLSNALGSFPDFNYNASADLTLDMKVGVLKDVSSSSDAPKFPNISGTFDFHWDKDRGVYGLGFDSMKINMGTFISGVLGPIVSKIQKVVEPLEPLIDFLTTPFPVLDDLGFTYTPLSLAKEFSKGKFDDRMVYAIKDLIEISKKIKAFGSKDIEINLGSMALIGGLVGNSDEVDAFIKGAKSVSDFSVSSYAKPSSTLKNEAASKLSGAGLNVGDGSWRFVWDNPTDVFKLLLGQDIALVEYDMPKLTFSFDWSTFIRIYGPLGARLGLSLGASIDLGFGYDTLGIRQWIGSDYKDYSRLLNGFYVNDLRDGVDVDELSFHGALTAAAELNAGVKAGVGGGVGINIGFNLYDPNKDGKIRLNEITRTIESDGLFGIFDVKGKITAKLYAYVDLLFFSKEWNITGDKTLCDFEFTRTATPVMISKSGDDVVANVGSNSTSRVAVDEYNVSLEDGDETLSLTINGETISDGKHTESTTSKLIINAEKGDDKIILKTEKNAAKFDIEINGGDGDDYIDLSGLTLDAGHYVIIKGGAGVDSIIGAHGLNIIFGDEGVLRVDDEKNDDGTHKAYRLVAETNVEANKAGGDIIIGGSKHDIIFGGAGNDQIDGGAGVDYIFGDSGKWSIETTLTSKDLNDKDADGRVSAALRNIAPKMLTGDTNKDAVLITRTDISLDGGKDTLIGGADKDVIYGGGGDDHIDGGAGDDEIHGEKGHDRILGGSGNDSISGGDGMDIIFGDRVQVLNNDVAAPFVVGSDVATTFSHEFIEAQFGKVSSPKTSVKNADFEIKLTDESGNPVKYASELSSITKSSDTVGLNGNDTINGDDGNDLIFGDGGADDENGGIDTIYGGLGNDIIDGDGGSDTIKGGIDNDIIYGGDGDDIIDGGAGNDSLYGDNGVTDYEIVSGTNDVGDILVNGFSVENRLVFGDNLGLHGKIYENAKSKGTGGNDKISTGPGMDFVDGQGGSDRITVKLMGDDSTNYANITDSGKNGMDSLFVEGTETDDQLLVRMNDDKTLGFVALLPVDKEERTNKDDNTPFKQKNSNIERVNIIKSSVDSEATLGVNVLNVNANGGNDKIYVDGTVETTNINGGAGNDGFVVGQLYNSARTNTEAAKIQNIDEFNSVETNEESFLSDGVTAGTRLNLEGGSGSDDFVALNNVGTLNMSGGKDDDKFSVYSFRQKEKVGDEYKAFERGAVLIDGGKGNDSLNIRGTDDDDTFVVTKEGMLSDLVAIKAAGVESTQFDAAAGDDMFHVLSNNAGDVTELNGGMGNDTFSMGGLDEDIKNLRSANTDGQNVELTYEIVGGEDADVSRAGQSQKESFTLVDTDVEPAVFILKKEGSDYKITESPDIFVEKEGSEAVFYVGCAGLKTGESITVVISAPMLSNMDFNRGDRGFIVKSEQPDSVWGTTTRVVLSGNTPVAVHVKALADGLLEEGARKAIAVSSTWSNGSKLLTKSVTSVGVTFAGDNKNSAIASLKKNPFVCTEDFVYNGNNVFKMSSILNKNGGKDVSNDISIYVNGVKTSNKASVGENGLITINGLTATSGDTITISVRTAALRIDDSKVALAYEGATITSVKVDGNAIGTFVSKCNQYYELNGNVITFYNGLTGQPMTMHGVVTVEGVGFDSNYEWENYTGASTAAPIHSSSTGGFLTIEQHSYVLTESMSNDDDSSDEDADPSNSGATTTPTIDFTSQTYNITYNDAKSIPDGKKVYVKITPTMLLANSRDSQMYSRLSISCADSIVNADGSITIYFDNTIETRSVTVTAVCDDQIDDYGLTTVTEQAKSIEPIDGAVYAYGYGKSMDLDTGNPAMLKYNHVIETGANKPQRAVQFNELNNFDSNKLFRIVDNASNAESNVVEIEFKSPTPQSIALLKSIGFNLKDDFDWDACLNDAELMNEFLAQFEHKTFKWVVEITKNVGAEDEKIDQTDTVVAAKWLRVESASYSDEKIALDLNETISIPTAKEGETVKNALISRNRDSIFVDEMASVDRLFVNNQKDEKNHLGDNASSLNAFKDKSGVISNEEKNAITANPDIKNKEALLKNLGLAENRVMEFDSNALRFNHSDIGSRGIVAAQMEYGEYNLGTGKDRVDVKKTLYRDDAFRTFTVVNTGDSGNKNLGDNVGTATITSSSYKNGLFCYEITSDDLWEKASYDSSAIYYVDAEIKKLKSDGSNEYETVGIQRREVVGDFSTTDGFNIKYDFILAEGEELGNLTFTQAEFDDEIVISKHQSDRENGNSKVVCSGTNVSKNVSAPAEESAATETPVASEEPAAEGDTPAVTEETGAAESESSTADTPAETETTGEEGTAAADAEKPAGPSGNVYSFTMNADDLSQFKNKYADFGTAKKNADEITEGEGQNKKTRTRDTNAYAFNLYVDATMSDGSVQRRVVNGMTENTFGIDRDFTWSAGVTIVSVKFAYGYEGDGQLVVNAQSGNDKIDASSSSVTRNDMVAFGGFGDDYITMNKGGIAFGDRGQVKYDNGKVNGVEVGETILGSTDGDSNHNGGIDYTTGIRKNHGDDTENKGPVYRLQTDGVNRDAREIRSMDDSNEDNGIDLINVGGTNSVVIGGDKADVIVIGGDKNVALGDNGRVLYNNAQNDEAVYGDKLGLGMHIVETTSDAVGEVDNIVIAGNKNVAMGGAMGDSIRITGADNVAIGDGGKYTVEAERLYAESKSDTIGGQDYISTGDGKNAVIGGTDKDTIYTGAGNDAIIGDGGKIVMDTDRNALMMTNAGRNINKDDPNAAYEDGSAGADKIVAGNGDNIVFGGLENDSITTGSGEDVVFGDNAYATFQGNYKVAAEEPNTELPTFQTGNSSEEKEIKDTSILSFNFTGDSDKRITSEMEAGVEPAKNWNNISGHLSGTYGNNDNEIVRFDDGTRASAISVSYGGHENHRTTSTDSRINLQGYNHWMNGNDGNTILMNSGLMTTAPNQQCGSLLEVSVDGLAQYYESYYVFVYLDIPDSHSSYKESVRKITLSTEDGKYKKSFYIDDRAGKTFSGSFVQSSNETADAAIEAVKADDPKAVENYVVFRVDKQFAADRIIIKVEDGLNPYNYNGKDLPGIAGLQIKGDLHKQDVAVSTDIDFGGNDVVDTNGGDDIVVGGTGNDVIVTYGDERYSIDDNDVVYGDNAKLLFADRDNDANTATTLTKAESIAATNLAATYDDAIRTGDGNDVVVGGIGSDAIFSGDVKVDDGSEGTSERFDAVKDNDAEKNTDKVKLDNLDILSFNFTANNSGDEARVAHGVAAGVVVDDDWHDFYRNDRGILMCDDTKAGWPQNEYEERVNKIANEHEFNTFATVNGVNVDLYGRSVQNYNSLGLSAYTQENVAELDGDTANSKIFNSSLALHSQEEIILKLSGLNNYLADKESGETKGDQKTYDVYVYLGGDNDNSDTYNFVYDIFSDSCGSYQGEHRYVNDWVGHFFDGDYREAKCTDANKARVVAENGVTPRIEMIGNYVVFRGVTGDNFTVHIRNYHIPGTNQWPKNLPVITAVQIVTGKGRFELNEDGNPKTVNGEKVRANVAIGGDHDKDLVFGDDAYLEFDVDIPFGVGEHINDFQNRVVSANSMAIKHDDAVKVDTRDIIYTGKDRDVVVGGEDADTIKTGAADDVVVGDNANLMMEHNNPIGVFTPSNEITLDDHTIDTSTKEDYLGHDNVTVETIQRKYDPNWGNQNNGYMGWGPNGWGWYSYNNNNARGKIDGIKEPADAENTGRKDNIVDDEGSNLLIEGQWGTEKLYDPESLQPVEDPNVNTDDPNNGNEDPNVNTDDPNNGNEDPNVNTDDPNNGNEDPNVNTDDPNNENQDLREVFVGNMYGETKISIGAGETIKLVITNWDKGDQWYTPNIGIKVDASGRHSLVIKWDELGENASQEQSGNPEPISFENVAFVDIPNTSNVENEEKIVLYIHSEEAFQFSVYLINLG